MNWRELREKNVSVVGELFDRVRRSGMAHRDDRGALVRIARNPGCEAGGLASVDQALGKRDVPGSNHLDAHVVDDILTPERRVNGGQRRGPELEAAGIRVIAEFAGIEAELVLGGEPAGDSRLKGRNQIFAHVEVREPRASTEPLERAGGIEVDAGRR